jgi:hypothetical protein
MNVENEDKSVCDKIAWFVINCLLHIEQWKYTLKDMWQKIEQNTSVLFRDREM